MSHADLETKFKKFIIVNTDGEYESDGKFLQDFEALCQKAKPKMEDILAELIIPDEVKNDDDVERKARIESWLMTKHKRNVGEVPFRVGQPQTSQVFQAGMTIERKREWVKMHLSFPEMITVLTEVQALESLTGKSAPNYADDIDKAKKGKDFKKRVFEDAEYLISDYENFINEIDKEIASVKAELAEQNKIALDAAQPKNKAGQTQNAKDLYDKAIEKISKLEEELKNLQTLREQAKINLKPFAHRIDDIQRNSKLSSKSEDKKEEKAEKKSSIPSVKSPYSSLSDRGKQAADSEMAKDLYQSFAAAGAYDKFMMITGPDAHNMLEIARNLSKVGDRQDLQEYCKSLLGDYITYSGSGAASQLDDFDITLVGVADPIHFPSIKQSTLVNGLSEKEAEQIRQLFARLHTINKQNLTVADLEKLQNYANALLISTTLQEAKWGLGKQITKGFFKIAGRKKTPNYDLGNDVSSFLKPLCERKDKIFKEINTQVDKGYDYEDFEQYGPSRAVRSGQRKMVVRTFDDR